MAFQQKMFGHFRNFSLLEGRSNQYNFKRAMWNHGLGRAYKPKSYVRLQMDISIAQMCWLIVLNDYISFRQRGCSRHFSIVCTLFSVSIDYNFTHYFPRLESYFPGADSSPQTPLPPMDPPTFIHLSNHSDRVTLRQASQVGIGLQGICRPLKSTVRKHQAS